jgi:hypothetical protein
MAVTVPPFVQYQTQPAPLLGRWNTPPAEGDRFINFDQIWTGASPGNAVQINVQGGGVQPLSQIVAIYVDNSRCGSTTSFIFIDSGFVLDVAPGAQGLYPVFTNAQSFFVSAAQAVSGDETIFQVFNSMPPPISIPPAEPQTHVGTNGVPLGSNGTTQIIPLGVNGTIENINFVVSAIAGAGGGSAVMTMADGQGHVIWQGTLALPANGTADFSIPVAPLNLRFVNGVTLQISGTTLSGTWVVPNIYYSQP